MDNKLKMDLQMFADEGTSTDEATPDVDETETTEETPATLTMEEVQKMIQSSEDKVRTQYSQQVKALEQEKQALVKEKMTEDEQRQYDLDQLEQQLKEQQGQLLNRELTIKTVDMLKDKELPLEFRDFLIANDEDTTVAQVEAFSQVWTNALEEAVNNRFKEGGRRVSQGTQATVSKQDIMAIKDPVERLAKIQEHTDLF